MPGHPVNLVRQGPTVLAVGAGMRCFYIFPHAFHFFLLPSGIQMDID